MRLYFGAGKKDWLYVACALRSQGLPEEVVYDILLLACEVPFCEAGCAGSDRTKLCCACAYEFHMAATGQLAIDKFHWPRVTPCPGCTGKNWIFSCHRQRRPLTEEECRRVASALQSGDGYQRRVGDVYVYERSSEIVEFLK
jgi:hypothetical protein